jgi:hypothetical protein
LAALYVHVQVAGLESLELFFGELRAAPTAAALAALGQWDNHRAVLPAAAMWICAAVPATPEVVTLPFTDMSSPTVMVPLPVAAVFKPAPPDRPTDVIHVGAERGAGHGCASANATGRHANFQLVCIAAS